MNDPPTGSEVEDDGSAARGADDADPADDAVERPGRLRRTIRRARTSNLAFAAWVIVVTLVAVPLLYTATAELGPGTVRVSVEPAVRGRTELVLPPLGSVTAPTHRAPVRLGVELREVDVLEAITTEGRPDIVTANDPRPVIEAAVRDDLAGALRHLALVLAAVACGSGLLAAATFPGHRSALRLLAGAALGGAVIGALVAPAAIGFDPEAFAEAPEFAGQLGSAEELLTRVGSLETRFGSVESRTRVLSERLAGLYSSATTDQIAGSDGDVVLLHVSDLHLNSVGLALARDLANSFDVDAVVDTGDITSFGFEPEAAFTDLLGAFDVPYYVVAGNHDSAGVRRRLAASDDVISLDGDVVDIAGLRVLGMADPTETALRRIPQDRLDATYRSQFDLTAELVEQERPDLLLVHNPVQIRPVIGEVPAAAAGHLHRTGLEIVDGTVIAVVGSSGATGVGNLLVDDRAPYRFELLRFVGRRLVAVDQIELLGEGGDFRLDRRLIGRDAESDDESTLTELRVDEPPLDEMTPEELDRITSTTGEPSTTTSTGAPSTTVP